MDIRFSFTRSELWAASSAMNCGFFCCPEWPWASAVEACWATLTAITVTPDPPPYAGYATAVSGDALQMMTGDEQHSLVQLLEGAQRETAQHAIRIETILSGGPTVGSLVEAARKNHIDLLVLGIHPEQGLLGWLTVSTAHELAQKAACDILAVR